MDLQLEIVEYALPASECVCPQCGEHLHQMNKMIRSELVFVPAQFKKVQHERGASDRIPLGSAAFPFE